MQMGRPHVSWLRQEFYLSIIGIAGLETAWAIARRKPGSTVARRQRVAPAYAPMFDLTFMFAERGASVSSNWWFMYYVPDECKS